MQVLFPLRIQLGESDFSTSVAADRVCPFAARRGRFRGPL